MPAIDLNIKYLSADVKVWRLYPGERRDLANIFRDTETVFLDLPSLMLSPSSLQDRRFLNAQIARASEVRAWHRAQPEERPVTPRNVGDYLDTINSRSTGQQYGNIKGLYFDARVGDLVVVPVDAGFESYLMIGEIADNFHQSDHHRIDLYGNDVVPFRRVRWITVDQRTRLLTPQLAGELRGRRAIRLLANELDNDRRDRIYAEVFELSYQNFIFKDLCEYVFDAPDYHQRALDVFPGAQLISAGIAYGNALVDNSRAELRGIATAKEMTVADASDSIFAEKGIEAFELDFASPGSYRVKARGRTHVLLAVAALVACMAAGYTVGDMKAMQVTNSGPIPVDMTEATKRLADQVVTEVGADQINQMIQLHRRAREKVGFQLKARVQR